jgi:hypothetical protein
MEKEKMIVRWITKDKAAIDAIRKRFQIPEHTTLNGLSPVEISQEDMPVFKETVRRGFMSIIDEKWCKNGGEYIFYSSQ